MRALITGASGFVGSHIAQALVEKGWEVAALVRAREGWLEEVPEVERIRGDVTHLSSLKEALASPYQLVVHCAGITSAGHNMDYYRVNALGTYNLVKALRRASWRPERLVYISSLAAAGPGEKDEESPTHPITPYGESKLYGEYFIADGGFPFLILRPPVIFGPRDTDVLQFFKWIRKGWVPAFFKRKRLSLVYVKTLVEALIFLLDGQEEGTFFVADGSYTWWDVARTAARVEGKRVRALPLPQGILVPVAGISQFYRCLTGRAVLLNREKIREMREDSWVCITEKIRSLGFAPSRSLEDAIKETLEWYRERGYL